jgi:hypothetical protein
MSSTGRRTACPWLFVNRTSILGAAPTCQLSNSRFDTWTSPDSRAFPARCDVHLVELVQRVAGQERILERHGARHDVAAAVVQISTVSLNQMFVPPSNGFATS